jgi:hypothetical protein
VHASTTQQTQVTNAVAALQALSTLNASTGASGVASVGLTQSSASISGLGQLFSNLQQLASQNPTQFQQVATQIASEIQTASQQQTGPASQFLNQLGTSLQQFATTGTMPQLHHHHQTQEAQSYNSAGQAVNLGAGVNGQTGTNASLQQFFVTLAQQVGATLGI